MKALVWLLLLALPALGGEIDGPAEVKAGGFAQFAVKGKTPVWIVAPEPVQKSKAGGVLTIAGRAGETYTVTAVVIDFKTQTVEEIEKAVRFLPADAPAVAPIGGIGATIPSPAPPDVDRMARLRAIPMHQNGRVTTLGALLDGGLDPATLNGLPGRAVNLTTDDVEYLKRARPAPAQEVPVVRRFQQVPDSHACPACGVTSPPRTGTWIVRGTFADGTHLHKCPRPECGAEFVH